MSMDASKIGSNLSTTGSRNASTGTSAGGGATDKQTDPRGDGYEHHGKVYDFGAKLAARLRSLGHLEKTDSQTELQSVQSSPGELKAQDLRRSLSPTTFDGVTPTSEFPKAGQDRLLSALQTAAGVKNPGYNVFITRYGGDGQAVADLLKQFPPEKQNPKDYVYVRNFDDMNQPSLIIFEPGQAKVFEQKVNDTLQSLIDSLPNLKGSSEAIKGRVDVEDKASQEVQARQLQMQKDLNASGFGLERIEREDGTTMGVIGLKMIVPAQDDEGSKGAEEDKAGKKQVAIVPMSALESAAGQLESAGLKPVFVLKKTTVGPAYEVMDQNEYLDKMAAPAVKAGQEPAQAYNLESIRSQFSEFHRQSLEMNAANEATMDRANKEMQALLQRVAGKEIDKAFEPIRQAFPSSYVSTYLDGIKGSIVKSLPLFLNRDEALASLSQGSGDGPNMLFVKKKFIDSFKPNVVSCSACSNTGGTKFPIVYEKDPTWENLLGTIREPNMILGGENLPLDRHKNIKSGSLLQAQGGYLVVDLLDSARLGSLGGLLRAITSGKLQIEPPNFSSNHPEPIPLNVKLVVLDPEGYYDQLAATDRTFSNNFIKAPYDPAPKAENDNMRAFASNLAAAAQHENLLPLDSSAMAGIMEEGMRGAESKERFDADFGGAMDLVREANAAARSQGASAITGQHVQAALDARKTRLGGREARMHEVIDKDIIKVATRGSVVGQINGLVVTGNYEKPSVMDKGLYDVFKAVNGEDWTKGHESSLLSSTAADGATKQASAAGYQFGLPARITATVSNAPGASVIPNDKDSGYLGPSTLKAFANIGSFLKERFGADGNVEHFEAHVSFEQNYGGIDGDSATQAKTIALLSALSGIPIKQGIAITGSMDVHGNTQAIGGVNYKIAGFYDICKEQGLDGTQGCVIPQDNVGDLMLRPDIVEAVKQGQFHIWPVKNVDQAVEIMTGVQAGKPDAHGHYPEGTVYGQVEKRLEQFREKLAAKPQSSNHHHGWNIAG